MLPLVAGVKESQRGAATLLLVLMLTTVVAIATLATTSVGIMEQRTVGNELRAREAQEAAEAGLEFAVAWAGANLIPWPSGGNTISCPGEDGCPTFASVSGSSSGETYSLSVIYSRTDPDAAYVKVSATSAGNADGALTATVERHIKQLPKELFAFEAEMPPPMVLAGCMTDPTGNPDVYILDENNIAVATGSIADTSCLPEGHFTAKTWIDNDGGGYKDGSDTIGTTTFNRSSFSGCPSASCSWNAMFKMALQDAKDAATDAGHVFSSIPCGAAVSPPSIYVVNNNGPINAADISGSCSGAGVDSDTIGAPGEPVLLIFPSSSGCPKFNGGMTVYGIIYFETTTSCDTNGWGGMTVYGSVIWEGDVYKPNANTEFVEVDYQLLGDLNDVFNMHLDSAAYVPGTWKDF